MDVFRKVCELPGCTIKELADLFFNDVSTVSRMKIDNKLLSLERFGMVRKESTTPFEPVHWFPIAPNSSNDEK